MSDSREAAEARARADTSRVELQTLAEEGCTGEHGDHHTDDCPTDDHYDCSVPITAWRTACRATSIGAASNPRRRHPPRRGGTLLRRTSPPRQLPARRSGANVAGTMPMRRSRMALKSATSAAASSQPPSPPRVRRYR